MSSKLRFTLHASPFTLYPSPSAGGFTLLAMMGILAIITIGVSMMLPNLVTLFDQQATETESKNLKAIGKGTQAYLQTNRAWPLTLAAHGPNYVPFANAQLTQNLRGYARYFALHPTMLTFSNQLGLPTSSLTDARFLVISDLSTNATPIILLPAQFETWWNTNETKDLRIYKGNLAGMFPQVNLSATGPGGSYQIDGLSTNSLGLPLANYVRHHVRGTTVSLDEANIYGTPEVEFQLTTDVTYIFVPCLPKGRRWSVPPMQPCPVLWVSTSGNASGNPGIGSWKDNEIVAFIGPDLTYESGPTGQTNGQFGAEMDIEDFTNGADLDAAHYVSRQITVGTVLPFVLNEGDLLLSTDADENLTSLNRLSVKDEDIFVFRPLSPYDYTAGTFYLLIDGSDIGLADVKAVTLVEWPTLVGDQILPAGTLLISDENIQEDVNLFQPLSVGTTTNGTLSLFIDGSDISIGQDISGIDLIETSVTVGDVALQPGQILVSLRDNDSSVGDNQISVSENDVFLLDLTRTGNQTEGNATLFFDGSDVGLSGGAEGVDAVTLNGASSGSATQSIPLVIVNPGFELGTLTGWSLTDDLSGNGGDNQWGAVTTAGSMPSSHSGLFFANGRANGQVGSGVHLTGIYQRVNVTAFTALINAGGVSVTVYAYGHGETNQDYAYIRVSFYDAIIGGNKIGDSVDSLAATESNVWKPLMINFQAVPVGTQSIEIMLLGHKVSSGSYSDTGFDDVAANLNLP